MSTVVNCDQIFVLDKGKVAESGTHSELLAKPGSLYNKLWSSQHEAALKSYEQSHTTKKSDTCRSEVRTFMTDSCSRPTCCW